MVRVTRAGGRWCVLCPRNHPLPAVAVYTDPFGFRYEVCVAHVPGLWAFVRRVTAQGAKRRAGMLTAADFLPEEPG